MNTFTDIKAWGEIQQGAVDQMRELVKYGNVYDAALMGDHHLGYSQPIGGVIAYRGQISPSGVGFDIACGNKAVRTDIGWFEIQNRLPQIADRINSEIEFGVGRNRSTPLDHELFESSAWDTLREFAGTSIAQSMKDKARIQLGTVGSGNHYVDVFREHARLDDRGELDPVWIGVHFGSRGLGHGIATGFLKLALGESWDWKPAKGERYEREEPTLLDLDSDLGQGYWDLMQLAGAYAYAGRDDVVGTVLEILGAESTYNVHNHHNFAWMEEHGGEEVVVIRKGATPLWPGQQSFIGSTMSDISVIVEGLDSQEALDTMRSTVHGAGRIMGRMEAKGKACKSCAKFGPCDTLEFERGLQDPQRCDGSGWLRVPKVDRGAWHDVIRASGIELRGGGVDESPFVYRRLDQVLAAHAESTKVLHELQPIIVCMAGAEIRDPYKD